MKILFQGRPGSPIDRPVGHHRTMEHERVVHIERQPGSVWRVLMDIESWPEWTASMTWLKRVEPGPLERGSEVQIKQPRLRATVWTVTDLVPGERFTWENSGAGVTTAADHELAPADGGTLVTLRVRQSGWLAGLTGLVGGSAIRRLVAQEAEGLKARCEGRSPSG
jgi:uncharacterized protein YndB with AHSA1/START domain